MKKGLLALGMMGTAMLASPAVVLVSPARSARVCEPAALSADTL